MEENIFFSGGSIVSVLTTEPIDKLLDYLVPSEGVYVGTFVEVELGKRVVEGLVWGARTSSLDHKKLKTLRILNSKFSIDPNTKRFLTRMAEYNLTSLNSIFKLTGWKNFLKNEQKASYSYQLNNHLNGSNALKISPKGKKVIELVSSLDRPPEFKTLKQISEFFGVSISVVKGLEKRGFVKRVAVKNQNKELPQTLNYRTNLNVEQQMASNQIEQTVAGNHFSVTLLRGVTGSGKTEVFLSVASKFISEARQVLILVPEIGLSSGLVSRIFKILGITPVEWNSGVSNSKKREIFHSLISGDGRVQIIVGARSALFLPFKNLGLIIIDEEHDTSFKQQDGIRFNARDMAVLRGHCENLHIILSSATPSLETILNCKTGKYKRVDLKKRFREGSKVVTKVIDMKNEDIDRDKSLSPQLINLMNCNLKRGEQVLLFLNRRGYAPLVVCKNCGDQLGCKFCDSKLVEHRYLSRRVCHQCGYEFPIDDSCASCGETDQFNLLGAGVERLMEECIETFPGKAIKIVSSDLTDSKAALEEGILQIEKGEIDIIIGTQIITKGHNFPFLSLVGIVDGDLGLYGADLRGAEKTFQIIQQVSGRVGRFGKQGVVAIQTWRPENDIIRSILKGDDEGFWEQELVNREEANVPPYSKFIGIILEGHNKASLFASGQNISREFKSLTKFGLKIFGPALAPISKIKNRIRVRLLIQCPKGLLNTNNFRATLQGAKIPKSQKMIIDVDPQNFL